MLSMFDNLKLRELLRVVEFYVFSISEIGLLVGYFFFKK